MSSFSPAKYGEKLTGNINDTDSQLHKNVNRLVKKGGNESLILDIDNVERLAANLRKNAHLLVKVIHDENVRDDFQQLLIYVQLLYGSMQYDILHDLISKHFQDLENVEPATIGAYCAGCYVDTSFTDIYQGCSAICAGSMPPKKDEWQFCDNAVILSKYDRYDDRFIFSISRRGETKEGRETAYIFVEYTDIDSFPGFNSDEKNQLSTLGIDYIYLNGYSRDGRKYIGLEESKLSLQQLKTRGYKHNHKDKYNHKFDDTGIIILLVLILLITIFFAWRHHHVQKNY